MDYENHVHTGKAMGTPIYPVLGKKNDGLSMVLETLICFRKGILSKKSWDLIVCYVIP
jgi:hypothetical protein